MNKLKHSIAAILVLCMVFCLAPASAFAADSVEEHVRQATAEEVEGVSRLETSEQSTGEEAPASYADDEMVTAIVVLSEAAVMDYFGISAYAELGEDVTPGEAVSQFLASDEARQLSEELLDIQQDVVEAIERLPETSGDKNLPEDVEVVAQWTNLVNAMAIQVPYGRISEIQSLPGVVSAYVEVIYDRPEEPVTGAGAAGYSYDMVGISEVWNSGYTGEGMLIAILDTGLDLEWSTYWDNDANANITGIRRVHEAFTENSFKTQDGKSNIRWTESAMARFVQTTQLAANTGNNGQILVYDNNDLYKNRKVPFAADYADGDLNVRPTDSDHGTHVAGTVAGYVETEEGEVLFSGIAPDAQILAMKVFPDDSSSGASESAILNALNDAALLGADVVNLSLGSDNGYSQDDTASNLAYASLYDSGILFMTSAGNAGYSSVNSNYGSYGLAADPEITMISSPAVYDSNLAVASINNTVEAVSMLAWTDADGTEHEIPFSDPNSVAMKYKFAGVEDLSVDIIPVSGTGTYSDYYNAGFRSYYGYGDKGVTGIALVQRGELSFADKINNASQFSWSYYDSSRGTYVTEYPIQAVLIYDNDPESSELIGMSVDGTILTSAFLSGVDGAALYAAATEAIENGTYVTLTKVNKEDSVVESSSANAMSSFSSWGPGLSLELKPEITAPGGNIWSSILDSTYTGGSGTYSDYTGSYGMMSGTSMAAPHMTGITALVKQYVMGELGYSTDEAAMLTQQLLVSTAVPQQNGSTYYSPRQQGAGLVSASGAVSTPAYITVAGQDVGKLELMDDPEKNGSYELTFQVNNLTGTALTYNAKAVLLRPATTTDENGNILMMDSDATIKTVSLGTVNVPANGSAAVSQIVSLSADEKAELNELFENGTYVEGFVILTDVNGENPQIGLPFLAFYGDWTAAPILDRATWLDEVEDGTFLDSECTWWPTIFGYFDGYNFYNLGQNIFDSTSGDTQAVFYEENITISPNGWFTTINDYEIYQLRDAKVIVAEVKDKETGELYYRDYATYLFKTYYDASYGMGIPASLYWFTNTDWAGTDLEGNVLPSGTQCVYTITAYGDGDYPIVYDEELGMWHTDFEAIIPGENEPTFNGHAMDKTGDVISFDIMVDTAAPKLVNNAVSIYEEEAEDGTVHTYIEGTFTDEGSIASIQVAPVVTRTYAKGSYAYSQNPDYAETQVVLGDAFYTEYIYDKDVDTYTFKADVTNYVHNESYSGESYTYDFTWTGDVYIYGGDYGGNDRAYAIAVDDNTGAGLLLSQTSAKLHVGSEFDLSVIDNTGMDAPIIRESSDPEVATIDEFGHVEALSVGQTILTVSNGTYSAICIVAVEEYPTEVLDFSLSLEHFSGLKPNGEAIVKVVDLYPADVVLDDIRWEISEDEETAEYYEGLINVAQYTTDGLQGEVYLNYSATNDPNVEIPGGSAILTVTLNGVSRQMRIDWEDLYIYSTDDDLVSDAFGGEQTVYVTQGETAQLIAKYNNASAHNVIPVELYSAVGAANYSGTNPYEEAVGLVLDGEPYVGVGGVEWRGKLVALPGYELPEAIQVGYYYPASYYESGYYECWWANSTYYTYYTYDPATGEIWVKNSPYGSNNVMVIRADGVENPDAPGGTVSGITYDAPDALYGPFDWAATEGYELTGELTTAEGVNVGYDTKNVAYYTPSEPGVSYITAASKYGEYSVNFAVICEPVKAEVLTLDTNNLEMVVGETATVEATLNPEPSLKEDGTLIWTSFNEAVATVDENGVITAGGPGYAFLKVAVKSNTTVESYCIVHVTAGTYTVTLNPDNGEESKQITVTWGQPVGELPKPTKEGYTFLGWFDEDGNEITAETIYTRTEDSTWIAKWEKALDPTPTDPEPTDPNPTDPKPTDPTPTDPEPTDPKPTDPKPTDPEPTDPEPTDPKPTDPEPTDPEPTDPEAAEPTTPGSNGPKTGDNMNLALWMGLMVLSVIAVAALLLLIVRKPGKYEKRK